jgi:HK97 family phage major capsid protein
MSGINTNRTSITLPAEVSSEIIALAQEESAVMRLARRINLPGRGLTIPVISGDPEANWVDETNAKPVSNPTLTTKNMKGYTLAVIVPFSNQFRRDMAGLYAEIVRRLPGALGKKFDATVFAGTAPGTGFDVLTGVTAQSISGTGNSFYKALVAAESAIATAGYSVSGYAMSPQGKAEMLTALDTTNRPIFINSVADGEIGRLLGQPVHYTKGVYNAGSGSGAVDVLGFAGDWSKAMYGIVEGVDISISDQATLTISNSQVNLWERNMFAVRAEIEVGFVAEATAFNKITRAHS